MEKLLMTPGPTNVPQEIREILARDLIHHRMPDFAMILDSVTKQLNQIFKSKNDTIILTSSGTGGMEASVINLFNPGEKVCVIDTGYFGERFKELCELYNLNVIHLKYTWGNTYNLEDIKTVIEENPDLKGIFITHSETSTGVVNDIAAVGELKKDSDILLVVDAISGMVVNPFEFDNWHIDCAVSSSQKGFFLPPGLAFANLSDKALAKLDEVKNPRYYFDFKKYYGAIQSGQNPYTPAISLIVAADTACANILARGLDNIQAEYTLLRNYLEDELVKLGFKSFVKDAKGNTLVSMTWDFDFDVKDYLKVMDDIYNIKIANGQGPYLNKMLRFGCIGPINQNDINRVIEATKLYLNKGC